MQRKFFSGCVKTGCVKIKREITEEITKENPYPAKRRIKNDDDSPTSNPEETNPSVTPSPITRKAHASSQIGENQKVPQEKKVDVCNMSEEDLKKFLEPEPKKTIIDMPLRKDPLTADELMLLYKGRSSFLKRESKENRAIGKYAATYLGNLKSFKEDVECLKTGESLYVFCFGYAKIWSTEYKNFLSYLTYDDFSRLYIGFNRYPPGAITSRPELLQISEMLVSSDDMAVLITNNPEVEILKKFNDYKEFDFVEPGNTPMKSLKYDKYHVLSLPPKSSAKRLFPKLQELGMPVELIDGKMIKLTEDYVVCEESVRVTEKASKILKLLKIKMFDYVVLPCCCWSVSSGQTGQTEYSFKSFYE